MQKCLGKELSVLTAFIQADSKHSSEGPGPGVLQSLLPQLSLGRGGGPGKVLPLLCEIPTERCLALSGTRPARTEARRCGGHHQM